MQLVETMWMLISHATDLSPRHRSKTLVPSVLPNKYLHTHSNLQIRIHPSETLTRPSCPSNMFLRTD